jgi:type VII secretion protein EccB
MQSRRDHVQAYQFATTRLATALVTGEASTSEQPMRRSGMGFVFGAVVAALVCGVFAVIGLISPGAVTAWKLPGSIILEKETGNRYLFLDGTLLPTLNTTSALLYYAGGKTQAVFRTVSQASLAGVPHGRAVGIPGAPDSLPAANNLLPARWALCIASEQSAPSMVVHLGGVGATPMPPDQKMLVVTPDNAEYVLWHSTVYRIASRTVQVALGLGDVQATVVPPSWIKTVTSGGTVDVPAIPGAGGAGPVIEGQPTTIGQLISTVVNGHSQYYVLFGDGVAPLNATTFALLAAVAPASQLRGISAAALAGLPVSAQSALLRAVPDLATTPLYEAGPSAVCAQQSSSGGVVSPSTLVTEQLSVPTGTTLKVPTGKGMLASAPTPAGSTGTATGQEYLITDVGVKFALSKEAAQALQLPDTVVTVPAQVLAAITAGPNLVTGPAVLAAGRVGGQ